MVTAVTFNGPLPAPDSYVGMLVKLEGLQSDVSSLPTNVRNGSSFYAMDTQAYYKFDAENLIWREQ